MSIRRWAAAALVVSLLGLVGCEDDGSATDGDPSPSLTTSPASTSPSTSTSSLPDEPTLPKWPAAADGTGDKAARAFARYWLEMVNYAQATGDTAPLEELHASHCSGCTAGTDGLKKAFEDGGYVRGGRQVATHVNSVRSDEPGVHVVGIVAKRSRLTQFDRDGEVVGKEKAGTSAYRLYLTRKDGTWVVGALEGR